MISNNISLLIGKKRMTVSETAKLAGVNYNTIYNLYHDSTKGIEFETMNRLCFALDCTPGELFTYTPD